jgi:hypothetical protein
MSKDDRLKANVLRVLAAAFVLAAGSRSRGLRRRLRKRIRVVGDCVAGTSRSD